MEGEARTGTTSLVTLALSDRRRAGRFHDRRQLRWNTSASSGPRTSAAPTPSALQTMVFAAADPERDQLRIAANVDWLERRPDQAGATPSYWPGSWTYTDFKRASTATTRTRSTPCSACTPPARSACRSSPRSGRWLATTGSSQKQRRELGLHSRRHHASTASMTCAGISSLIITGLKRFQGQEFLHGDAIQNCGKGGINPDLQRGIDWLARNFQVGENFGNGQQWKYYYLYGLERAGRLDRHPVLRRARLVSRGGRGAGPRAGPARRVLARAPIEDDPIDLRRASRCSFLAKGRAPVLINKLRHAPSGDWNNDPDDIRNLVGMVSRDWKSLLTWQVVDPNNATVEDLLQAPIVFFNGHEAPEFSAAAREEHPRLRRAGRLHLRRRLLRRRRNSTGASGG